MYRVYYLTCNVRLNVLKMFCTEIQKLVPEERRCILLLNEVRSINGVLGTAPDMSKCNQHLRGEQLHPFLLGVRHVCVGRKTEGTKNICISPGPHPRSIASQLPEISSWLKSSWLELILVKTDLC